ncbi:unnamed protein product [Miscanthus lutarioriparius]|uniref:F-box protein n=1 Tax=Miscanthus lutarioriparius TaxID=422564 RepID=A0A811NGT3_9POAL|nr:unnamed protein product [Miscanthus lutarioriparius]
MAGWSSLPGDLINRIADRLLATDDLDYYMDFRAVCRGWRSSTADPKSSPREPRFRPRQWAMLDEVHQSDARLFVNAGTGRFVRRDLPLLRRYFVVACAAGGMVVLAERTAPHAARVLNSFTGAMVSFEAPVPSEGKVAAHVIGSSPTLVLLCEDSRTIYWADPDSKSFMAHKEEHFAHPLIRLALEGGIYAAAREDGSLESLLFLEANMILDLSAEPFAEYFAGGAEGGNADRLQSASSRRGLQDRHRDRSARTGDEPRQPSPLHRGLQVVLAPGLVDELAGYFSESDDFSDIEHLM